MKNKETRYKVIGTDYEVDLDGRVYGRRGRLKTDRKGKIYLTSKSIKGRFHKDDILRCSIAGKSLKDESEVLKRADRKNYRRENNGSAIIADLPQQKTNMEVLQDFVRERSREFLMRVAVNNDGEPIKINKHEVTNFEMALQLILTGRMKSSDLVGLVKMAGGNTESAIDDKVEPVKEKDVLQDFIKQISND